VIRRLGFLTVLTAFVNVGLVARDLILAYKLGNNPELNFFLQCAIVPLFALGLITNNLATLLVPASVGASVEEKTRYLKTFLKFIFPLSGILLIGSLALGLTVETWSFLFSSANVVLWIFFLASSVANMVRSLHNAEESYVIPLWGAFFGSLVIALGYWCFAHQGPLALALTNLGGVFTELLITAVRFRKLFKFRAVKTITLFNRRALLSVAPLLCTGIFIALNGFIDQLFASAISQKGLSILLYANKFPGLVMGILGTAIGSVALTEFSKKQKAGLSADTAYLLRTGTMQSFIAGVICSIIIWLLAPELVALAFQRGEFSADDTQVVAHVVRFGIWLLPPYFVAYYLKRYLMALGLNFYISIIYASNVVLNVLLDWMLSRAYGLPGLALASALVQTWSALMTIAVIKRIRNNT
jgi:putative peptidoglycan lipid II flippase